jgi:hypothetical protein
MAGHLVRHSGHVAHARRVDPVIVELEQRADRDRVVERFVRPTGLAHAIDIILSDRRGIGDHLLYERVERAIFLWKWRGLDIVQNGLDEISIAEQLRRDRGV